MAPAALAREDLVPLAGYVKALRPHLDADAFAPARSRLLLVPLYLAIAAVSIAALGRGGLPWFTWPLLSLAIGAAFAGLTFIAHETVHGGIVRGRRARWFVGWVGFLPFTLSPRLWAAWHDRVHHASANATDDPDMYPTLAEYQTSGRIRFFVDAFSMGGRRWRGILSLVLGFTIQSTNQLIGARAKGFLRPRAFALALLETTAGVALWVTVALLIGGRAFVFAYVIPLVLANMSVMAFILTNHGLSPRVEINDPLASGLSVTTPRWLERLTLNFGYHVEHHLFPGMSSRHAPRVRDLVRARWPERYQSMPLSRALALLHRTARVYKDGVTLVDPRTGAEFPTLLPGRA